MKIPEIEALLVEAGTWAQANGIKIATDRFGVYYDDGKWMAWDNLACVIGAAMIQRQPPLGPMEVTADEMLGIDRKERRSLTAGFDNEKSSLMIADWYALGARLRARFIGAA